MGEDGAPLRDSSLLPGSATDTHTGDVNTERLHCEGLPATPTIFNDLGDRSPFQWKISGVPSDIFDDGSDHDDIDCSNGTDEYNGVSACPAAPPNDGTDPAPSKVRRTALHSKTTPGDAFARGHLDALPVHLACSASAAAATDGESEDEELDLEHELEMILDGDGTPATIDNTNPENVPTNVHGGYLLQIDNIIWCSRCGAAASLGNTSKYLRKPCEGRPKNASMGQRRKRLMRHQHPTTCAKLQGTHKRVRFA